MVAELLCRAMPELPSNQESEHQKQQVGGEVEHGPVANRQVLGEGADEHIRALELTERKEGEHRHRATELHNLDIARNARKPRSEQLRQTSSDHGHARD